MSQDTSGPLSRALDAPDLSRRRLLMATAAGLALPLLAETPALADDANIRRLIVNTAESEIGSAETGNNYYPSRYKVSSAIVRPAEWCGVFAYYCWYVGGATRKPNMSGSGRAQGHWATYWQHWAKKSTVRRWRGKRYATPGDAVVYGNWDASGHIGIVTEVRRNSAGEVTQVRTVEGNVGDRVKWFDWRRPGDMYVVRGGSRRYVSGFVKPVA